MNRFRLKQGGAAVLRRVARAVSKACGVVALLVFSAQIVWSGFSTLRLSGSRLGEARTPGAVISSLFMVAIASLLFALGAEIALYVGRYGWLAMFRRAFKGTGVQTSTKPQ